MSKLSNLLTMIQLLKTGRKYSLSELATKLEVSERTIREYKLFLEETGIYLETIRGRYGGYVLRQEIDLPSISFKEQDVRTIDTAIDYIKDEKLKQQLIDLSSKVNLIILDEDTKNKKIINNDTEIKIYNVLSKAIKNHYKVKITYFNKQHGESIRTIYPLGLYLFQNEWWCSSYWEEKDDMRQFHLKRIINAEIIDFKFNPKEINIKF